MGSRRGLTLGRRFGVTPAASTPGRTHAGSGVVPQGSVMIHRIVSTDAKIPNSLIGAAGEYLIAAELSRRGCLATATIKNIKPKER